MLEKVVTRACVTSLLYMCNHIQYRRYIYDGNDVYLVYMCICGTLYVYKHMQMRRRSLERAQRRCCKCVYIYNRDGIHTMEMLYIWYVCGTLYVYTHTQTRMQTLERARRCYCMCVYIYNTDVFLYDRDVVYRIYVWDLPPKNGVIALWLNTRVVKYKYYVSQKQNGFNNKIQWYSLLLTCIHEFMARL